MRWLNKVKEASEILIDGPDEIKVQKPGHAEKSLDPFKVSGEAVKVFFSILKGDVWLCSDAQAHERVKYEGIPCFTFEDLQYIHQGDTQEQRDAHDCRRFTQRGTPQLKASWICSMGRSDQ